MQALDFRCWTCALTSWRTSRLFRSYIGVRAAHFVRTCVSVRLFLRYAMGSYCAATMAPLSARSARQSSFRSGALPAGSTALIAGGAEPSELSMLGCSTAHGATPGAGAAVDRGSRNDTATGSFTK